MKYNWNNLICNPEDERIQGLIGEEVFASISPMYTMIVAERGEYVQKLIGVDLNFPKAPFICENSYKGIKELNKCSCIIPKNNVYYSYEEVIFSPYDYRLNKIKGKKVYASSTPNELLQRLNSGSETKCVDLISVNKYDSYPFHTSDGESWTCIIEAKEC